jgi:hypothetical protein
MTRELETETLTIPDVYGRPLIHARVPKIQRRFRSPLHDASSMPPRLGGWQSELAQVLGGCAPLARLAEESLEPDAGAVLRRAVCDALEQGFAGGIAVDVTGATTGRIAIPDAIAETVDLSALRHDWLWWLNAAGELNDDARAPSDGRSRNSSAAPTPATSGRCH